MVSPGTVEASVRREHTQYILACLLSVFVIDYGQSHKGPNSASGHTFWRMIIYGSAAGVLSPMPLMTLIIVPLCSEAPAKHLNGWYLLLAFTLTVPVSLWAIQWWSQLPEEPQPKHAVLSYERKAAARTTLKSPVYRVLYLFHFGSFLGGSTEPGLVGTLRDLSSAIGVTGILISVGPWNAEKYTATKRLVFLSISAVGLISTALLSQQVKALTVSSRTPRKGLLQATHIGIP